MSFIPCCIIYSNISLSTTPSTCAGINCSVTEIQPPESSVSAVVHKDITQWFGAEKAELKSQDIPYGRESNAGLCVSPQQGSSNVLVLAEADKELVAAFSR